MNIVLSIICLLSVIWSNVILQAISMTEPFHGLPGSAGANRMWALMFVLYILTLLFDGFSVWYCVKAQKKVTSSEVSASKVRSAKGAVIIAAAGLGLFLSVAIFVSLIISIVEITGGA